VSARKSYPDPKPLLALFEWRETNANTSSFSLRIPDLLPGAVAEGARLPAGRKLPDAGVGEGLQNRDLMVRGGLGSLGHWVTG
jgi:hypothetical protein